MTEQVSDAPRGLTLDHGLTAEASSQALASSVAMFLETTALGLVLLLMGLYLAPLAGVPSLSADSGTALSISRELAHGNAAPLVDGLFPPLQTAVYAAMFQAGLVDQATAVPAAFSLAFAVTLSAIALAYSRSLLVACVPIILLFFSEVFWRQSALLTFYPAFATFGIAGLVLAGKYVLQPESKRWAGVLGGVLLAFALYAFTTAILYLPIPALLLACYWSREHLRRTLLVYGAIALPALPWLVWHLWVGGTHFYYHPLNWFVENHLAVVNREFWQYPQESLQAYAPRMLGIGLRELLPLPAWPLVVMGIAYVWGQHGARAGLFVIGCIAFFLASLLVIRPSPFGRYFYPILPLAVLLAAAGFQSVLHNVTQAEHRAVLGGAIVAIVGVFLVVTPGAVADMHRAHVDRLEVSPAYADLRAIAGVIDDEGGVISRDSVLQQLQPANQVNTVFSLNEAEYVTYLSWQDEAAVTAVLQKHDIRWVLLYTDAEKWERGYNVWLQEAYGVAPQHYLAIRDSANFTKVYEGPIYTLFKRVAATEGR